MIATLKVYDERTTQKTEKQHTNHGYLPFTRKNRKLRMETQTVRGIPNGKLQKK